MVGLVDVEKYIERWFGGGGWCDEVGSSGEGMSVSSPEEQGEYGGNFADVGEHPLDESEEIDAWDTDERSDGEV